MSNETIREDVRIVELEPLRVASVHGFGPEPEMQAWAKLQAWAAPRGYLEDPAHHRIFGFNNPNPSAGSPNYGYEFWIEVGPDVEPEGDVRIVDFRGGAYAVSRVEARGDAYESIPQGWQRLHRWCEEQGLRFGHHQWLEQHIGGPVEEVDFTLDLHMPILK